ncbi:MAG TPA: M61 family peptidase [Thermoanaerobaculia bacterium]|nr:M61 family peptidase [Thermoanaerobaculia bacterium]
MEPSVTLPRGWRLGTALTVAERSGDHVRFKAIDFENLVDSPIMAGKYFKRFDLAPGAATPVHLDVFADEAKDLEATPKEIEVHRKLVEQMYDLYGAHHYDHYDFLLAVSDKLSGIGLEHHRSSEDGSSSGYFTKWKKSWIRRTLLSHEFNHSWDGKYRRPAGLWTPSFNVVKRDWGLWVYEGQTQFWGEVMAARSGLWSHEQAMSALATLAATYDRGRPGMAWRNIQDTTNDPTIAERAPIPYRDYQMSEDYYRGGELIWFAVDSELRDLTHDKRSLDDFARAFFGMDNGAWDISTYTFDDVVAALNRIAPYDWKDFLRSRLDGHDDLAQGLADEGWKVVYNDEPSIAIEAYAKARFHASSFTYSVGLTVNDMGELRDVLWNGPAFKAGLAPGMTLIAVDRKEFKPETLKDAIVAATGTTKPIELTVKDFDELRTLSVDYHGGLQIPHLVRIPGKPDYLSEVLAARK